MFFELAENAPNSANIKVMGVGGGGGNAVEHMLKIGIAGVEFICANTDVQALERVVGLGNEASRIMKLGLETTKGLGAGANPDVGRMAALESQDAIEQELEGVDMLFITAGMGGGTGTGAAPIVAEIARRMDILTVAVVTKPFSFEGKSRRQHAEKGIQELSEYVNSLIVIPNDRLLQLGKIKMTDAFAKANDVLSGAVRGISELITRPGLINVDFADVRTVMSVSGLAKMGAGMGSGENAAITATEMAVQSPLLEDADLSEAKGILVNITVGEEFDITSMAAVGDFLEDMAADDATIVFGTAIDETLTDEVFVTFIATGMDDGIPKAKVTAPTQQVDVKESIQAPAQVSVETGQVKTPPQPQPSAPLGQFHNAGQGDVDRPAIERRNEPTSQKVSPSNENSYDNKDFMNVPSFLRTQAD